MLKPTTIATHEAIRAAGAALRIAADAPGKGLPSVRVLKPLRRIINSAIETSWDVAPPSSGNDWSRAQQATEYFVGSTIDLIEETMRRAVQASLLDGKHPAEAVRDIETTLKSVLAFCANRHAGGER